MGSLGAGTDDRDGHARSCRRQLRPARRLPGRRSDRRPDDRPDRGARARPHEELRGLSAMFNLILKNLGARKMRLLITSFAVLIGVAFMAGKLVFTDTIGRSFDGFFAEAKEGTDSYVRAELAFDNPMTGPQRPRLDTSLIDVINDVDGVRVAEGYSEAWAQVVGSDGKVIGNPDMGAPVLGGPWIADEGLNAYAIDEG